MPAERRGACIWKGVSGLLGQCDSTDTRPPAIRNNGGCTAIALITRGQRRFTRLSRINRLPQVALKSPAAHIGLLLRIKRLRQAQKAALQISNTHVPGPNIDVEKSAQVPGSVLQNPSLIFEPSVKRGSRESGQERDLHFV